MTEPTFLDYAEDAKTYTQPLTAREERALRRKERANQDQKVLYRCVFKGVIFVQEGEDKKVVPYEETVFMDHALIFGGKNMVRDKETGELVPGLNPTTGKPASDYPLAIHVFVKYYADSIFKAKYPGYIPRPKEHHLIDTKRMDGLELTDIRLMGRDGLMDYIDDNELDVEPDLYESETEIRTAIAECEADPKGFKKQQEARKVKNGRAAELRRRVQTVEDRVASLIARSKELEAAANAPQDFSPAPPEKAQPAPTGDAPAQSKGGRPRKPTVDEQLGDV